MTDDGGNALSGEPHLGRSGAVQHLLGVRIDELGVEDASGGQSQLPRWLITGGGGHLIGVGWAGCCRAVWRCVRKELMPSVFILYFGLPAAGCLA